MRFRSIQGLLRAPLLAAAVRAEPTRLTTRAVFEDHARFVLRMARRLGVRPHDVEDVAQEVFMIVHRRLTDLQPDITVRSWLFGITRRVVANYRRKARHTRDYSNTELEAAVDCDPVQHIEGSRNRALLERALEKLDTDKREVFVLFELEGLEMREVADMLGCRLNTAYSRLYAARQLVRQHVQRASIGGRHDR